MRIIALYRHPLKSGRPVALSHASFDHFGLAGDRAFMVVDAKGEFITGRKHPELARVQAQRVGPALRCRHQSLDDELVLELAIDDDGPTKDVRVWGQRLAARDLGERAAAWFCRALGRPGLRLVQRLDRAQRPVNPDYASRPDADAGFTDGFPLLVVNLASLRALNERLRAEGASPVDVLRFRPNLVVDGKTAWEEDQWSQLQIGSHRFAACKPCTRCVFTTVDPQRATKGREPLRSLRALRPELTFGVNLIHETGGAAIAVGDQVTISRRSH